MNKSEALEILATEEIKIGNIDDNKIVVCKEDIIVNLECNGFELDLEFIQDLTCVSECGVFNMFQGHSLSEVEF